MTTASAAPIDNATETIRTAFATLAANPADNMIGFEELITALPNLLEAVAEGLTTTAQVSEDEFRVHPGIPDAYRDAALYARSLGERVTAVHAMYRELHHEQIENIENPTPQGAKWDQSANQ